MSYSLDKRFNALCQITRASYFEWRETLKKLAPDVDLMEAVTTYYEIVGHDTAKAYLKRIDPQGDVMKQLAQMIVDSSAAMGEDATLETGDDCVQVVHHACPWYAWHQKYDAIDEDRPGCDRWFQTIVSDVNQALGCDIHVETVSTIPEGDDSCTRMFRTRNV